MKKLVTIGAIASLLLISCSKGGKNELKPDKSIVKAGESISVTFTAQDGLDKHAWIGIIPSETPHGSEAENDKVDISYKYLNGQTSGTLTFNAPATPGKFDFRLNESDSKADAKELSSVSFTVE